MHENRGGAESSYGHVYVNFTGLASLKAGAILPPGTMIVREKLLSKTSQNPELLVAMVKREPKFNPDGGDWEFLELNSQGTTITRRETQGECYACHKTQTKQDFLFGQYFRKSLKKKPISG
ncbi:MAG TPA: cytochrome P460 family protein [Acidobacteriota bacterium]|nr:cytochrome P460 family protein [Acidobacteriota bacterium]HNB72353.1 cytochrome P460 family protein [Acidobacteriota bacterium]